MLLTILGVGLLVLVDVDGGPPLSPGPHHVHDHPYGLCLPLVRFNNSL